MRRHVAATILTVAMVLGGAATAQDLSGGPGTGKQAGDVLVRGRVLGVSPMDLSQALDDQRPEPVGDRQRQTLPAFDEQPVFRIEGIDVGHAVAAP